MAEATVRIPITGVYGYVDERYPNTVYLVQPGGEYRVTPRGGKYWRDGEYHYTRYHRYLFFKYDGNFPESLKYNRVYKMQMTLRALFHDGTNYSVGTLWCHSVSKDFDPRTLTWNTMPTVSVVTVFNWYKSTHPEAVDTFADILSEPGTTSPTLSKLTANYLKNVRCFSLEDSGQNSFDSLTDDDSSPVYSRIIIKPELGDGSLPYFTVTYDDEEVVSGQVAFIDKISGQIDQGVAHTLTWDVGPKENTDWYCVADSWEQTAATIYYREQGAQTWTEISIQGDTKQYTFPPRTFGSDKTYEYYIEADDVSGGSSESATFTFSTPGSQITPKNSPTSGYANPRNPITFSWEYSTDGGFVDAGSVNKLYWRESGTSAWTEVDAGSNTSVTLPTGTFLTLKNYEWYLTGEDTYGYASTSQVYSFSTSAAQISSTPILPINTIENKNEIIHFEWEFTSNDGAPASRCILQYKHASDGSWNEIVDLTGNITEYDVPAYTFDAGAIEWRVVPYNIDEVLGTATPASFIAYGAPLTPTVYTDGVPFLTIRWQAEEQESYQIMVDEESYGPYFGTEKRFALPSYLEDGQHTVKIRTMGVYGLWSKWGEATVQIENQPGEAITMQVQAGRSASLSWETEEETSDFLIYRDGKLIGRTDKLSFTDRFVLGEHVYVVVNRLPDGNYSKSSEVTGISVIALPCIVAADSEDWIDIQFSLKSSSNPSYDESVDIIYSHLSGNTFPSAFLSNYQETVVNHSVVFLMTQLEEQRKFMALKGKQVILKLLDGSVVIGIMEKWTRKPMKSYWMSFEFSLRQAEWEDYIDDTQ